MNGSKPLIWLATLGVVVLLETPTLLGWGRTEAPIEPIAVGQTATKKQQPLVEVEIVRPTKESKIAEQPRQEPLQSMPQTSTQNSTAAAGVIAEIEIDPRLSASEISAFLQRSKSELVLLERRHSAVLRARRLARDGNGEDICGRADLAVFLDANAANLYFRIAASHSGGLSDLIRQIGGAQTGLEPYLVLARGLVDLDTQGEMKGVQHERFVLEPDSSSGARVRRIEAPESPNGEIR